MNVLELDSFINLIKGDIETVENAVIYDYSNGLTEVFNNKTKVIKDEYFNVVNDENLM